MVTKSESRVREKRPKDLIRANKQRIRAATGRISNAFLEKVLNAVSSGREIYPRDDSETERRMSIVFRLFPRTIVRAATELRPLLERRLDRLGLLRLGKGIGRLADAEIRRAKQESTAPQSACRKGCHFCCHLPVETTVPQVMVIAEHLNRTLDATQKAALHARIDEYEARIASGKQMALCPLNVDGACSVYEARPTICRSYNSTDAGACERALSNEMKTPIPMDYAPIGAELAVQTGYMISGLIQGQPYPSVPLIPALKLALDLPEQVHLHDFQKVARPIGELGTWRDAR